jgi:hypothetical protein
MLDRRRSLSMSDGLPWFFGATDGTSCAEAASPVHAKQSQIQIQKKQYFQVDATSH